MTDKEFLIEKESIIEEWRQLIYDGELQNYDISNKGNIRNHNTCMIYKLSKIQGMKNYYEFFCITLNNGTKKNIGIHRLMAIMFLPVPKKYFDYNINELVVDHKDNIKCHNILSNLQWLTKKENTQKWFMDVNNIKDVLVSDKVVKKICKSLEKGETIYDISVKYDVSEILVYDIRYKKRHADISKDYTFPNLRTSNDTVVKICELLQDGKTCKEVAEELNVSEAVVYHISCGDSWTFISKNYTFPNSRVVTDEKRELIIKICELLQDGNSPMNVAKMVGTTKSFVQHIATRETHSDISKGYVFTYTKFKTSDDTVHNICKDLESGKYIMSDIAKRNNVSLTFVKDIKYRKLRTEISNNYSW